MHEISSNATGPLTRYRLYSAHDTNIANFLMQINPSFDFKSIPYASNIYFELHKMEGMEGKQNRFVRMMYNGRPLSLEKCRGHTMCPLDLFIDHMENYLYNGNLREACFGKIVVEDAASRRSVSAQV